MLAHLKFLPRYEIYLNKNIDKGYIYVKKQPETRINICAFVFGFLHSEQ